MKPYAEWYDGGEYNGYLERRWVRDEDVAWLWTQVSALAPFAWFLGELKGNPAYPFEHWSEHIPCLWTQIAQAAICRLAEQELDHAQWSEFTNDLQRALDPDWQPV